MEKHSLLEKYRLWLESNENAINTYANHLIVIFAFSIPLLVSVRRVSISLIILLFLARGRIIHHLKQVLHDPVVLSFALYFLVHVLWLAGSDDMISAKKSLHDAAFLLFVPLFVSFIDKKYVGRIAGAFILGMVISSIISYGMFFDLVQVSPHNVTQGVARDPTPLYHHTHYGFMLAITAVILLYKFIELASLDFYKLSTGILFILIAANTLIIEGRSGFVLFVILTFIMLLLHYRRRAIIPVMLTSVIIVITSILSYSYIDVFKDRVDLTIQSSESAVMDKNYNTSIGGRAGMLVYSLDAISGHMTLGRGTGDHVTEVRKVMDKEKVKGAELVRSLSHTHNEFVSSLLQFGILGFLAFLNIPYQMMRYSSGFKGAVLKITGSSILLFSMIEVFIMGAGMILSTVIVTSTCVSRYYVTGAKYKAIDYKQLLIYGLVITAFYLLKLVMP